MNYILIFWSLFLGKAIAIDYPLAAMNKRLGTKVAGALPHVDLMGDDGGRLNGKHWTSREFQGPPGHVFVVFHAAPAAKDENNATTEMIKRYLDNRTILREKMSSYAVVNMKASSWPNFILNLAIKQKQREYPNTTYLKDKSKLLVKKWNLKDEGSSALAFNHLGELIYFRDGPLNSEDSMDLVRSILSSQKESEHIIPMDWGLELLKGNRDMPSQLLSDLRARKGAGG